jgi:hypothetical protein
VILQPGGEECFLMKNAPQPRIKNKKIRALKVRSNRLLSRNLVAISPTTPLSKACGVSKKLPKGIPSEFPAKSQRPEIYQPRVHWAKNDEGGVLKKLL